jgi:hypothetical protein
VVTCDWDGPTDAMQGPRGRVKQWNQCLEADPRDVGESYCTIWIVDQTLVQNQLKALHSIVQMKDLLAHHICGKLCVARICVSSNYAIYEEL